MSVGGVKDKFDGIIVWTRFQDGAELEEDVGRHRVDPEHEGSESVQSGVTYNYAGKGVDRKETLDISTDEECVRDEIVNDESESDLSKEGSMEVWVEDVDENCKQEEEAGESEGSRVKFESEFLKK